MKWILSALLIFGTHCLAQDDLHTAADWIARNITQGKNVWIADGDSCRVQLELEEEGSGKRVPYLSILKFIAADFKIVQEIFSAHSSDQCGVKIDGNKEIQISCLVEDCETQGCVTRRHQMTVTNNATDARFQTHTLGCSIAN